MNFLGKKKQPHPIGKIAMLSFDSIVLDGGEHVVIALGRSQSSGSDHAVPGGALGLGRAAELSRAVYSCVKATSSFPPPKHLTACGWTDRP